jgi:cell division protein FtsZ
MTPLSNFQFSLGSNPGAIIKVIGIGGAGGNAVNHMFQKGIKDVDFLVCNTDYQALERNLVRNRLQLGPALTEGRGAGNQPEIGRKAAVETMEEFKELIGQDTKMVFITAGLGGGTGTGAAPVLAEACRALDILTVGIVTLPFSFEGKKRLEQAEIGLKELRRYCDTTLVISNDKVRELFGNLVFKDAFAKADDVLASAAKGIAEIITVDGYVNVDFADVRTVLQQSGKAVMGSGQARGENRALEAVRLALSSPLLSENDISGARNILINMSSGNDDPIRLDEIGEISDYVQTEAGSGTDVIWGNCTDEELGDELRVTLIATGFEGDNRRDYGWSDGSTAQTTLMSPSERPSVVVHKLDNPVETPKPEALDESLPMFTLIDDEYMDDEGDNGNDLPPATPSTPVSGPSVHQGSHDLFTRVWNLDDTTSSSDTDSQNSSQSGPMAFEAPVVEASFVANPPVAEANDEVNPFFGYDGPVEWDLAPLNPETSVSSTHAEPIADTLNPVFQSVEDPQPVKQTLESTYTNGPSEEDVLTRSRQRIQNLRSLNSLLSGGNVALEELEKVPAYVRAGYQPSAPASSSDLPLSRTSVTDRSTGTVSPLIKTDNRYLHDNVD